MSEGGVCKDKDSSRGLKTSAVSWADSASRLPPPPISRTLQSTVIGVVGPSISAMLETAGLRAESPQFKSLALASCVTWG